MKQITRAGVALLLLLVLSAIGGHFYFDQKFTPPPNHLQLAGTSGRVPIVWEKDDNSSIAALLLPVAIPGVSVPVYMQLDLGSPSTIFYSTPLKSLVTQGYLATNMTEQGELIALAFAIGELAITSNQFRVIDFGEPVQADSLNVIGTLGSDLIEKSYTRLNFKDDYCLFSSSFPEDSSTANFLPLEFNKRRILVSGKIDGNHVKLLFDSGTSAYSLITSRENWNELTDKQAGETVTKGSSWGKTLAVHTKPSSHHIWFGKVKLPLQDVTYIEGTSTIQNLLMKLSGMEGMIGNKLFMGKTVTIDISRKRFSIEE